MAHISEISSGTFTTLAYVGSDARPAGPAEWDAEFRTPVTGASVASTTSTPNAEGTAITTVITGTTLPILANIPAGRIFRVAGTDNTAGVFFTSSEITAATATRWTVTQNVPSGTTLSKHLSLIHI